ncbi:MAG: hypothetical protein WC073_05225 [Sterolibacterium sp.]
MIYPSDIDYRPFSDEQVENFAKCAGLEYANDRWWRSELDEAARDLVIGHFSQQWSSPSDITKALKRIASNPDSFFMELARSGAGAMTDPVATSLRHGTGWTDDQLLDAANHRDEFIAGVGKELAFLRKIISRRKEMNRSGNSGNPAMSVFLNQVVHVYWRAFGQVANIGLSNNGQVISGPFIKFVKSICAAMKENLSVAVRTADASFATLLNGMVQDTSTSIGRRFTRLDYYSPLNVEGDFHDELEPREEDFDRSKIEHRKIKT